MSLRAAVDRMTQRLGLGPSAGPLPCPSCAPRATPALTTRILARDDPGASCAACGRPTDSRGRPVGVQTPRGPYVCTIRTDSVPPPAQV